MNYERFIDEIENVGCHVGSMFVGCMLYNADNIVRGPSFCT